MPGGVAGVQSITTAPYADRFRVFYAVDRIRGREDPAGAPRDTRGWPPAKDVFAHRADHDATFLLDWPGLGGKNGRGRPVQDRANPLSRGGSHGLQRP